MFRQRIALGTLWIACALHSSAFAAITAFWQQVPITPEAIAEAPELANMQTWDLMTTTTGNWAAALIFAELPPFVRYYKHPLGRFTNPDPLLVAQHPALAFTSHVTSPHDNGTNDNTRLLGGFPTGSPMSIGDPTSELPGAFSVQWGDFFVDAPGTYYIARLTFPEGVFPAVRNNVPVPLAIYSATKQIDPEAITHIPEIPEPSCLGLVNAAAVLLGARRHPPRGRSSYGTFLAD